MKIREREFTYIPTNVDITYISTEDNKYIVPLEKSKHIKNLEVHKIKKWIYLFLKRFFDIVLSLIGIVFVCILAIFIKISYIVTGDFDSIIFKQLRTGKNGKNFKLYKVRSMTIKNDVMDNTTEDQFTKVGKIIRKFSLDELLQIVNILKGDMSFIGPRPWIPEYYENMNTEQRHRCDMRPGISGYAQVKGRNTISIFDKINYDLEYINKASLFMDLKIIVLTIATIFGHKGVDAGKGTIHEEIKELKKQDAIMQ